MAQKSPTRYMVTKGRIPGIYMTWSECLAQVSGFAGAVYCKMPSSGPITTIDIQKKLGSDYSVSICTDAACQGNPGKLEYRGVCIQTGQEIFSYGPYPYATVNIGEYLALVAGIQYCLTHPQYTTIYTDSITAMARVRDKQCKTIIDTSKLTPELLRAISQASDFLCTASYRHITIKKRQTSSWGEIPADYGRK